MTKSHLPHKTLVVVATGTGAKFFRNVSKSGTIQLKADGTLSPTNLEDEGPSGKTPADTPGQEIDEATFSKQLANDLYRRAHAGKFDHLALVADPGTLGQVRPLLHQEVTDKIVLELDKTLTNSTTDDIEKSLQSAL